MESEKVKEIKKCFEERAKTRSWLLYKENDELVAICFADILTYINELESENQQLKNRIAELDNLVAEIYVAVKNSTKETEELLKREIPKFLTNFAERLKEEIPAESTFEYLGYNGVIEVIDETLKEFIGK